MEELLKGIGGCSLCRLDLAVSGLPPSFWDAYATPLDASAALSVVEAAPCPCHALRRGTHHQCLLALLRIYLALIKTERKLGFISTYN
jgi:hypothetical protein